jgi:hypothetical protein
MLHNGNEVASNQKRSFMGNARRFSELCFLFQESHQADQAELSYFPATEIYEAARCWGSSSSSECPLQQQRQLHGLHIENN